jgi:ATP-dependent Clp protease, protease subunit
MLFVHRASTYAYGNREAFLKIAEDLGKIDKAVVATYTDRFVGEESELIQLLADESFLNADEALTLGFCDEIVDEIEIPDPNEEDDDDEIENFKEDLINKYVAMTKTEPKKPTDKKPNDEEPPIKPENIRKLFLHL